MCMGDLVRHRSKCTIHIAPHGDTVSYVVLAHECIFTQPSDSTGCAETFTIMPVTPRNAPHSDAQIARGCENLACLRLHPSAIDIQGIEEPPLGMARVPKRPPLVLDPAHRQPGAPELDGPADYVIL